MSARGRKPDPTVDHRIRQAATALVLSRGFDFTMDDVAAAAGVGRASVFRRYATKRDMLLETIGGFMNAHVAIPDTGSLEGDLRVVVADTLALWRRPGVAGMAKQVFGEAGRDPAVAEIIRTGMRTRMERSWVVYERAIERGELPPNADLWLLTDLFTGFVAYRGLLDLPLPEPEEIVQVLLHGFTPS
ncbi:TetR/AcrR family transcriptional regulator C-terminal ligand-binding domain-containing protein [Nonomuraea sp. K274]|uniref:TetR/AcrR family transcriptional regulator C-terminal ligand-binding domain-containing protein n=1 Tax=Nonomuraea cypriaca TaxID=1187855 RepID=A0A931A458_9ACTN|nr:TetR-like C-terminal domain-containing protein [Nonomuraea cypriaca]MBF8185922.1 TetR/AcrR family transcriptional regulator C-terminal ligand-binding domain-containing protein [Nonomuraea cypriaca]